MIAWAHRRRERLDGFAGFLIHAPGASVLDLGCHRGLVSYEFAIHGATMIRGVDIDLKNVNFAIKLFEDVIGCNAQFGPGDLTKGPAVIVSNYFDFVLMLGVYHKLKRTMARDGLDDLMRMVAHATRRYFIFNGTAEDHLSIDRIFSEAGFKMASWTEIRDQYNAVWERW